MRFRYAPFPVRGTLPNSYALALRPLIPVRVIGPRGGDDILGLVDTGADDTLLPDFLINPLGIVTSPERQAVIGGIGGAAILVRYGAVDLEIGRGQAVFRWSAYVGFCSRPDAILGHKGFLNVFTATFNGRRHHLDLTPNGIAPPPGFPTP